MPAKSKKQQRLMGMAYAAKKGELDKSKLSPEILKIMKSMSKSQIRDFAKTKSSDLPETSKKEASEKEDRDCCTSTKDELKEKLKLIVEKNGISKIRGGNTRALNLKQYKLSKKAAAVDPYYASGFKAGLDENTPINANITVFENPFKGLTRHRSGKEWQDIGLMGGLGALGYMGGSMVSDSPITKGLTTLAGLAAAKYMIDTGKDKDLKNFFKDFYSAVKGPTHSKFRDWVSNYIPYFKYPSFTERMKGFYDKKFASTTNSAVSNAQLKPTKPIDKQSKKPWYQRLGDAINWGLNNTYMGGGSSMGMLATKPDDTPLIGSAYHALATGKPQQYNKLIQERKNMRAMGLDPSKIEDQQVYNSKKPMRINPVTGTVQPYIGTQGKSEDSTLDLELLQAAQQGKPLSPGAIEAARSSLSKQLDEQLSYLKSMNPNDKLSIQAQQNYINGLKSRVNQFSKEVLPLKDSLANRRALRANPERAVAFGDEAEVLYGKGLKDPNNPINKLRNRQKSIINNYINNRDFSNDNIATLKADYEANPNDPRAAENYRRGLSAISTATREKQRQQYMKSMSNITPEERNALLERQRQSQKIQAEDERLGLSGRAWDDKDIQWAKSHGYSDEQIAQAMRGGIENDIRPDVIEKMKKLRSKSDIGEKYYAKGKQKSDTRRLNNLV